MVLVFRGIAEVVFLEMGQTSVNNNFSKDSEQKWYVRDGAVILHHIFVKRWPFQQRFDNSSLHIMWYNAMRGDAIHNKLLKKLQNPVKSAGQHDCCSWTSQMKARLSH